MKKRHPEDLILKIFPWEQGKSPDHSNKEGYEWYIDEVMTKHATTAGVNGSSPIKAVCFYVKKGKFITRVLVDDKKNILYHDTSAEAMACKIDILKLAQDI